MAPSPSPVPAPVTLHPPLNEAVLDELPSTNSISSVTPSEPPGFESVPLPVSAPTSATLSSLTFVNGCRTSKPCPVLETSQDFDADIIGDDLDDLLDQAGSESEMVSEQMWPRGHIDGLNVAMSGRLNRLFFFSLSFRLFPQWRVLFLYQPVLPQAVPCRVHSWSTHFFTMLPSSIL